MDPIVIVAKFGVEHCLSILNNFQKHWLCRRSIDDRLRKKFLKAFDKATKSTASPTQIRKDWEQAFEQGEKLCQSLRTQRWVKLFKDPVCFETVDHAKSGLKDLKGMPHMELAANNNSNLASSSTRELTRRYFDEAWYTTVYPDVALAKIDAFAHFYDQGWKEGRNPHAYFNTKYYLEQNPDVGLSGQNPLEHFVTVGWRESRSPSANINLVRIKEQCLLLGHLPTCPSLNWLETQEAKHQPIESQPRVFTHQSHVALKDPFETPPLFAEKPAPLVKLIAFYEQEIESSLKNGKNWNELILRKSLCKEHYQPRLPGVLGCYDQRVPETLESQIKLAKQYDIGAFCFRVPASVVWNEKASPLHFMMQEPPRFDFPFMVSLQVSQHPELMLSREAWEGKIEELTPLLQDARYLRFKGRAVLVLDGAEAIPDLEKVMLKWRACCRKSGIGKLFLLWVEGENTGDLAISNLDAAIQSPQYHAPKRKLNKEYNLPSTAATLYSYSDWPKTVRLQQTEYPIFKTVLPGWDQTGLGQEQPMSLYLRTYPKTFTNWLFECAVDAYLDPFNEPHWIFVNAWNDWRHSAYLEPDTTLGYEFLQATSNALLAASQCIKTQLLPSLEAHSNVAICLHVASVSALKNGVKELNSIESSFEEAPLWVITTPVELYHETWMASQALSTAAVVLPVKNVGGSTRAFFITLQYLKKVNAKYGLRLSLPNSPVERVACAWRKVWLTDLVENPEKAKGIIHLFEEKENLGVLGAQAGLIQECTIASEHRNTFEKLAIRLRQAPGSNKKNLSFADGMFWFRREALDELQSFVPLEEFEDEEWKNGVSESVEQLMISFVLHRGFGVQGIHGDAITAISL